MPPPSLTTSAAARVAGVELITIQMWIRRGKLKAVKTGRDWMIAPADLARVRPRRRGRKPRRS